MVGGVETINETVSNKSFGNEPNMRSSGRLQRTNRIVHHYTTLKVSTQFTVITTLFCFIWIEKGFPSFQDKVINFCHKLWFSNLQISANQSVWLSYLSLKYQKFSSLGCKDIKIENLSFWQIHVFNNNFVIRKILSTMCCPVSIKNPWNKMLTINQNWWRRFRV